MIQVRRLSPCLIGIVSIGLLVGGNSPGASARAADNVAPSAAAVLSHPPARPLPLASSRPLSDGPMFFVDGTRGDDAAAGTKAAPWRTIARGLRELRAGDTLCLRGVTSA